VGARAATRLMALSDRNLASRKVRDLHVASVAGENNEASTLPIPVVLAATSSTHHVVFLLRLL
jgi:hypothetical protein